MNDQHPPPLESPYGPDAWPQPPRERILIDDEHAVMSARDFDVLKDYSASLPSGVYPGKLWRRLDGAHDPSATAHVWLLGWYGPSDQPGRCSINFRRVLLA